jgi:uncharacterized protein (DUF1697 family)
MQKQVGLIRGINVGRAKRIAMAELRQVVEGLGYTDVRTLLNSGNIVFSVPAKVKGDAAERIQAGIADQLGVSARVMVVAGETFGAIVAENSLSSIANDPARMLVAFLRDGVTLAKLAPLASQTWSPDVVALGTHAAYLWCAGGILESKLLTAVGRITGDAVTTRNWTTVLKLRDMLAL